MTKTTNPGWPDPTEWAKRLANSLAEQSGAYFSASDVHEKQVILASMLNHIVSHLNELPAVASNDLALPIMHIVEALSQASEGHKPALFENKKVNATRRSSFYWPTAKEHAVITYFTLADAGYSDPAGYVAMEMNRAGLARRKGEKQTAKSILRFVNDFVLSNADDKPSGWVVRARDRLSEFRTSPEWPLRQDAAKNYTQRVFQSKRLRPFS